jgi:hypothetical protein
MSEKACNICEKCGKSFKYPSLLKNHLASKKPCKAIEVTPTADPVVEAENKSKPKPQPKPQPNPKPDTKSERTKIPDTDSEESDIENNTESESDTESENEHEHENKPYIKSEDVTEPSNPIVHGEYSKFYDFMESYVDKMKPSVVKFISRDIARSELAKAFKYNRFRFTTKTGLYNLYPEDVSLESLSRIIKTIEALMDYDQLEYSKEHYLCQCNKCNYMFIYPRKAEESAFCLDCRLREVVNKHLEENKLDEAIAAQRIYMEHLYNHRMGEIIFRVSLMSHKQEEIAEKEKELNDQKQKLTKEVMAIVQARNLLPMSNITVNSTTTTTTTKK